MHRRLPDVIENASAMQSSLVSRTISNFIQLILRWGWWGSNPRPADYEKYGPMLHAPLAAQMARAIALMALAHLTPTMTAIGRMLDGLLGLARPPGPRRPSSGATRPS
jgi:hypothetical protein